MIIAMIIIVIVIVDVVVVIRNVTPALMYPFSMIVCSVPCKRRCRLGQGVSWFGCSGLSLGSSHALVGEQPYCGQETIPIGRHSGCVWGHFGFLAGCSPRAGTTVGHTATTEALMWYQARAYKWGHHLEVGDTPCQPAHDRVRKGWLVSAPSRSPGQPGIAPLRTG